MSDRPWTESDRYLSNLMFDYWVIFAKNGDPNESGLPERKPFTTEEYRTIILAEEILMATRPSLERLKILDKYQTDKINDVIGN